MRKELVSTLVVICLCVCVCASGQIKSKDYRAKAIAGKNQFLGANGIYIDDNDLLYVASAIGCNITVMKPNGKIVKRYGSADGVENPDDLVFAEDGTLYWTELFTGNVGRMTPGGKVTKQFVAPGVNPITLSDDGRLFVALDFLGTGLYEVDPKLKDPPVKLMDIPGHLNGFDFGQDGLLYGPLMFQGKVIAIDVDAKTYNVVADGYCSAVKFNSEGELYGVNMFGAVNRIDTETGTMTTVATLPCAIDNLAFDSRDRLFVCSYEDGSVSRVEAGGKVKELCCGGLGALCGIAVLPLGGGSISAGSVKGDSVYVANLWSLRLYDGRSGKSWTVDKYYFAPTGLTSPITVSADTARGYLILTSWWGNQIQVYDPDSKEIVRNLPYDPAGPTVPLNAIKFKKYPKHLVAAEMKVDGSGGRIVKIKERNITKQKVLTEALAVPIGLAATDKDLWVSDWYLGAVFQVIKNDRVLKQPLAVAGNLSFPEGLALDLDGSLLVVETGAGTITRIDPLTGAKSTVASGLDVWLQTGAGCPPTWGYNGLAVGKTGSIYISSGASSCSPKLIRLTPRN